MNTKKLLQKTFIKLYSKKDYNSITIKELCAQAPVARTTFYSYFSNIDELKTDIETTLLDGLRDLISNFQGKDLSLIDLHDFLRYSMAYIENNWEEIYAFLIIQPNVRFIEQWKTNIKEHFKLHYATEQYRDNYNLVSEMIASSAIDCIRYWMQHREDINEEKLFQMIRSMINSIISIL